MAKKKLRFLMAHQNYGLRMRAKHGKPPHERKRECSTRPIYPERSGNRAGARIDTEAATRCIPEHLGAPSLRRVLGRLPSWLAVRGRLPAACLRLQLRAVAA